MDDGENKCFFALHKFYGMDSLAVHDLISTNLYRIYKPDTIVMYGKEIIKNVQHTRLFEDTIVTLNPAVHYSYIGKGDTLMLTGQQILDAFPLITCNTFYPVMAWGAFFFGAIIGWNLYFINHHREKTAIAISDLGLIVTALANGALLSFFDKSNCLLGWYGVGLGIGFILFGIYLIILAKLGVENRNGLASKLFRIHVGKSIEDL